MGSKQSTHSSGKSGNLFEKYIEKVEQDTWMLPKEKYSIYEGEKKAVLFFYGTFCPFHQGHLDVMKKAEEYVRNSGYNVMAGYISPCHP